jgi:hypothetical protein
MARAIINTAGNRPDPFLGDSVAAPLLPYPTTFGCDFYALEAYEYWTGCRRLITQSALTAECPLGVSSFRCHDLSDNIGLPLRLLDLL